MASYEICKGTLKREKRYKSCQNTVLLSSALPLMSISGNATCIATILRIVFFYNYSAFCIISLHLLCVVMASRNTLYLASNKAFLFSSLVGKMSVPGFVIVFIKSQR